MSHSPSIALIGIPVFVPFSAEKARGSLVSHLWLAMQQESSPVVKAAGGLKENVTDKQPQKEQL
ncbi:MAG: hypothetical protein WBW03_01380 [Silvibacterium sp.]|jgi:hypothetical protein